MKHTLISLAAKRLLSLRTDEVAHLKGAGELLVTRGAVWLTLSGELDDHFLRAGDRFTLQRGADAVLQAYGEPAGLVLGPPARALHSRSPTLGHLLPAAWPRGLFTLLRAFIATARKST